MLWVLIIRILLFRVPYKGPPFSETPIYLINFQLVARSRKVPGGGGSFNIRRGSNVRWKGFNYRRNPEIISGVFLSEDYSDKYGSPRVLEGPHLLRSLWVGAFQNDGVLENPSGAPALFIHPYLEAQGTVDDMKSWRQKRRPK